MAKVWFVYPNEAATEPDYYCKDRDEAIREGIKTYKGQLHFTIRAAEEVTPEYLAKQLLTHGLEGFYGTNPEKIRWVYAAYQGSSLKLNHENYSVLVAALAEGLRQNNMLYPHWHIVDEEDIWIEDYK